MKLLLILPFIALISVSCSSISTPEGRIGKNPQLYNDLNGREQLLVKTGKIENGMSKSSVWLAWGEPGSKSFGQEGKNRTEQWVYHRHQPVYTQSIFGGHGYGRFRHYNYGYNSIGLGVGVNYVPVPSARVKFQNDRVVSWTQGSRR